MQTELFVFLTPHIIENDDDADRLRRKVGEAGELLEPHMLPEPLLPDSSGAVPDSTTIPPME